MPISIRDPIHGSIPVDDWALPLIDAPVFQRLRRVHQLGMASLVYPGAHHKRFEHSLGAYHLAGRIADAVGLEREERDTVRAAALLHDVGHGPFSHTFEELLKESGRRHEETTVDLVRWGPLADLLRQGGIDPVAVSDAVIGQGPLARLVSGAIDADRMDYLLRDAHYTGLRTAADPDRLCRVLERDDEAGIVLRESGVLAAEALLTTRFMMYPAVYLHHTVRAADAMLLAAIRAHVAAGAATLADLERETDDALLHRLRGGAGRGPRGGKGADGGRGRDTGKDKDGGVDGPDAPGSADRNSKDQAAVAAGLVDRLDRRRLYKRAVELGPRDADMEQMTALASDQTRRLALAARIADAAGVPEHHVQLDIPHAPRFRELDLQVRARDGTLRPIAQASRLVEVLQEARLDHWRAWVFCPRRDLDKVVRVAQTELA